MNQADFQAAAALKQHGARARPVARKALDMALELAPAQAPGMAPDKAPATSATVHQWAFPLLASRGAKNTLTASASARAVFARQAGEVRFLRSADEER